MLGLLVEYGRAVRKLVTLNDIVDGERNTTFSNVDTFRATWVTESFGKDVDKRQMLTRLLMDA
eukprot:2721983-Pleurochrysis_carterae.AAC.1